MPDTAHKKIANQGEYSLKSGHTGGCFISAALIFLAGPAWAADYPVPVEGDYSIEDFRFHTGDVLPELNIHYTTVGNPDGRPVLILHGTAGTGSDFLSEGFGGALFGPGQALDANEHFIILPDAIGTGGSGKPSDGLRTDFPRYNYDDMVAAQYQLVREHFGLDHLHLVMGNSMGGMQTWLWGIRYPDFMNALVPMASLPGPMSGRNWMMRRMLIDAVRNDPAWNNGDYVEQPPRLRIARVWFSIATTGGNQRLQRIGSTNAEADAYVDRRLAEQIVGDANDVMYQWDSSRDFDPSSELEKIKAPLLVINSEDDERNPPELGILESAMDRIPHGQVYIIPASGETSGHSTTGNSARFYADQLADFLEQIPTAN